MTNKPSQINSWLIANDICKKRWEWREGQPSYATVWMAALDSYGDTHTYLISVKINKCSQFPWWQYKYGYPNLTLRSSNTTSSMRLLVNKPSPGHFLLWGSLAQSIITLLSKTPSIANVITVTLIITTNMHLILTCCNPLTLDLVYHCKTLLLWKRSQTWRYPDNKQNYINWEYQLN